MPEPPSGAAVQCSALLAAIRAKKEMWRKDMPDPQCYPTLYERSVARIEELRWMEHWVLETVAANAALSEAADSKR